MAKIRPLNDFIAVQIDVQETTTESGLVIVDSVEPTYCIGVVCAVGPGRYVSMKDKDENIIKTHLVKTTVKVGDRIAFPIDAASEEIKLDDETFTMITESSIFGVIE